MTHANKILLLTATVALLRLGLAPALPPPVVRPETEPVPVRIAASRFRADRPIGDARYSPDGSRVVGFAGATLYVWDASTGALLRTIGTPLAPLDDPDHHRGTGLAFAVHPRASQVALGGVKDGKTILQLWDYESGKLIAETAAACDALKALAWTPDGKRLLERANVGWTEPTAWKLVVRDGKLDVLRSHDLPQDFGDRSTVLYPLPRSKQVLLWQHKQEPAVFDLEAGTVVRTILYDRGIPSDLALSPDGKILAVTSTEDLRLVDFSSGTTRTRLPVLREGWVKPRPLFSPDGATVYVWDHRPIAYDVATGKEKWKGTFRTIHTVRMRLSDVSPDGATVLVRHGHALSRLDARIGTERDPPDGPSAPQGLVWSPDGKMVFTRAVRHDRTWTAWDARDGRRLFDLLPTGFVADDNWKMQPDLFFLGGGRELVASLERSESTERSGPKELLVFDATTGRCLRRLGEPLPAETFRSMHLIAVDPAGATVVMQQYAISFGQGPPGAILTIDPDHDYRYAAIRWDPIRKVKVQEWIGSGHRTTPPRHYAPYVVTLATGGPDPDAPDKRLPPARIRCYALADGRLSHEMQAEHTGMDLDRIQGNFLLAVAYNSKWVVHRRTHTFTPQPPFAHELWELPSRAKVRLFETGAQAPVALGPGGRYVLRVRGDAAFEVYEPFVLKQVVATVATASRPERFEFSPDGSRVAAALADASVVVWDATAWQKRIGERLAKEVPTDLTPLWDDLAGDAATGLRAARLLGAAGDRAASFLGERIAAKAPPDQALLERLIADLDSPVFATRERAEKELQDIGGPAEALLRQELHTNPSPEARKRLEALLRAIETRQLTAAEVREVRAVQALAWADTGSARALLAKWAQGDLSAALTKAAAAAGRGR
jgi:WD40 repeat protein